MSELEICVTFDVDFADYTAGGAPVDDFAPFFASAESLFRRHPHWRTTWFVRLDRHVEAQYGHADYIFRRYAGELGALRAAGHEIGWHPHCYAMSGGGWRQSTDVPALLEELSECAPAARDYGLRCVRMGWGFHTNETMRLLAGHGFLADSSAIPRPRYPWEEAERDWRTTPQHPYFPSVSDYRVPGRPALPMLEVPISVAHIAAPYDTGCVLRYFNPAYRPELFGGPAARWLTAHSHLVTITHPYEVAPRAEPHGLLAFDPGALEENLLCIEELTRRDDRAASFVTMSNFACGRGDQTDDQP